MTDWADKTALDILSDIDADFTWDGQCSGKKQEEEARCLIAQALRDERKRCAEIAEEIQNQPWTYDKGLRNIAKAIRGTDND
jgi:hypothetical protein